MAESNPTVALLPDHDSLARDPKAIEDYSNAVTQLFESLKNIVSRGEALEEATESILLLEKKARQVSYHIMFGSRLVCNGNIVLF